MPIDLKFFRMLELINSRLANIENNISRIDEKIDFSIQLQRNHLIRIKNGQDIDDDMILMGRPYNDITPARAYDIYYDQDIDFIFVDVTSSSFDPSKRLKGVIHIPLEELGLRSSEIRNKTTPIMIISERGLRSIQASELMVKKGFFNVNNVSGGYEFWPGLRQKKHPHI